MDAHDARHTLEQLAARAGGQSLAGLLAHWSRGGAGAERARHAELLEAVVGTDPTLLDAWLWPEAASGWPGHAALGLNWQRLPLAEAARDRLETRVVELLARPEAAPIAGGGFEGLVLVTHQAWVLQLLDRPDASRMPGLRAAAVQASPPSIRRGALGTVAWAAEVVTERLRQETDPVVYARLLSQPQVPGAVRAAWLEPLCDLLTRIGRAARPTDRPLEWAAAEVLRPDAETLEAAMAPYGGVAPDAEHPPALSPDALFVALGLPRDTRGRLVAVMREAGWAPDATVALLNAGYRLRDPQTARTACEVPDARDLRADELDELLDHLRPRGMPGGHNLDLGVLRDPELSVERWARRLERVAERGVDVAPLLAETSAQWQILRRRAPYVARLLRIPHRATRVAVLQACGREPPDTGDRSAEAATRTRGPRSV